MSSVIRICPECGNVGAVQALPEETVRHLVKTLGLAAGITFGWRSEAYWCAHCETPWLVFWPAAASKPERRQLVGLPADLVEIDEEEPQR